MSRLSQSWVKHWEDTRVAITCRLSLRGKRRTAEEEVVGRQQRWKKESCWNFRDHLNVHSSQVTVWDPHLAACC